RDEAFAEGPGLKDAAIEKDGVWGPRRITEGLSIPARRMAVQKCGEVASDRRIADVRQAHLVQTGTRSALRLGLRGRFRKEPFEADPPNVGRSVRGRLATAAELSPAAQTG